ncbi:MAG: hypothetical protein N0C89_12415 [Candidatus Thiodiazotropha endolucinida]|nr:hypothetical protein [Candidatus Thiodiazotropha sp. (ex Lucina pensylvanica)]MBT3050642.1 hypothetical protein [Candidatus Thiodiazotropha sp. (ex Codakia orbicularis)]MCG8048924.1 hypothetical protein [Candidatus Thiodiazotropha taylori]MCG8097075.1 hypothetical protein [Candidatus Thiodiazotropha endolucinida]MCG8062170.1 hypothetical protein [Candidatus Thiodiazotropha taylori]
MSALKWLKAGTGGTLIEAYLKSVRQPGEDIFIGDPLAAPFDHIEAIHADRESKVQTRNLKPGNYRLTNAVSPIDPFKNDL